MKLTLTVLCLFLLSSIFSTSTSADPSCVYTIYVRTANADDSGTDSIISAAFSDAAGNSVKINNLASWGGKSGLNYKYFANGSIDVFTGQAACITGPVCKLVLTSDGSGKFPSWYCRALQVVSTGFGKPCNRLTFTVNQRIAPDAQPEYLTAVRDYCGTAAGAGEIQMVTEM